MACKVDVYTKHCRNLELAYLFIYLPLLWPSSFTIFNRQIICKLVSVLYINLGPMDLGG